LPGDATVTEGEFDPIVCPIALGVHEFAGPARLMNVRLGLPNMFGGPRFERAILIMTPISAGIRQPFLVDPVRDGATIAGPSVISVAGSSGDMIPMPTGPFRFSGPVANSVAG
jgi:hypothetical protein